MGNSPRPSLFVSQRSSTYSQGNILGNVGETRGGVMKKVACWRTKRVKIELAVI